MFGANEIGYDKNLLQVRYYKKILHRISSVLKLNLCHVKIKFRIFFKQRTLLD